MAKVMLETRSLTKRFGDHRVLDGIDLQLATGTTTAVLGASGCGKTTLLRIVAGFETPDDGSILIAGRHVAGHGSCLPAHRRQVGYVAQDGALFPHLSVGQNIGYGLRGGLRRPEVAARVRDLLDMVSLDAAFAARRPHELSGGQQQRVALARALARQPVLMLLDEPFSALDTGLRAATRKTVAAALSDAGITTLLVTHDQEEALSLADQMAVMRDGRFVQVGTPEEIYRQPSSRFTAEFLGNCVLLAASVRSGTADTALGPIPVSAADQPSATIMVRPEQIVVRPITDSDSIAIGTVIATEFLGPDVILTIALSGDSAPLVVRQSSAGAPSMDAKVRVSILGSAVLLDAERW
ncbi:MAG: ABC transporter ATP-binding protein [Mycobacterium sp.]